MFYIFSFLFFCIYTQKIIIVNFVVKRHEQLLVDVESAIEVFYHYH